MGGPLDSHYFLAVVGSDVFPAGWHRSPAILIIVPDCSLERLLLVFSWERSALSRLPSFKYICKLGDGRQWVVGSPKQDVQADVCRTMRQRCEHAVPGTPLYRYVFSVLRWQGFGIFLPLVFWRVSFWWGSGSSTRRREIP